MEDLNVDQGTGSATTTEDDLLASFKESLGGDGLETTKKQSPVGCIEIRFKRINVEYHYETVRPADMDSSDVKTSAKDDVSHTVGRTSGRARWDQVRMARFYDVPGGDKYATFKFYYRNASKYSQVIPIIHVY
jgi:hypothetical protein